MFPFWNSLRFRLILLVILGIVPSLFLILFNGMEQRRAAIDHAQETAFQLAKELSKDYEVLVQTTRNMLASLAQDPALQEEHSADRSTLFETRLRDRLLPFFANIGVADVQGNVIYSAVPLREPVNVADGRCFRQAVETRNFSAGEYGVGRIGGKRTLHFAYPVLDKEGNLTGVTFAAVDLAWIEQVLGLTRMPNGASITLVDERGTILVRHPDRESWSGKPAIDKEVVRKVLDSGEGMAEATGLEGIPKLFGFAPLGISAKSGYIYVGLPKEMVVAAADRVLMRSLVWLAAAGVLGLAAAWFFTYLSVMRRVNTLVGASRQLSSGNLQARTRLDPNSGEIGHLGGVFDHMAESLEIRERDRKAMQDELMQEKQFSDAMMESLPGFFYVFDERFKLVRWNKSAEVVTGYSAEEIFQMGAFDFIDEVDLPLIKEGLKEVFEKGEASREARLVSKNGERRSYLFNGRLFAVNGKRYLAGMALDIEARKQAEESLRRSELLLRTILATSPVGIVLGRHRTIQWANQAWEKMFGFKSEDEYEGKSARILYASDEEYLRVGRELYSDRFPGEVLQADAKLKRADGSLFDVHICQSLLGLEGASEGTGVVVFSDITERKQAEEALRESENMLRSILVASPVGICLTRDRLIRWANKKWEQMFGLEDGSQYLNQPTQIMHVSERQYLRARDVAYQALQDREVGEAFTQFKRRDGSTFDGRLQITYLDPADPSKGTVSAISDVSATTRAEQALRQSEYRYRTLFEDSRDAAFVTARDGTLIDANQSYLDLFKYDRADIIGRKVHQTYADAEARKKFVEEIKPSGSVKDYEVRLLKKDGSKIDALITASVRRDFAGAIVGYQGIIRDVTELKRWQEERNRLAIAVDQAADTIAITDKKGQIQYVNPAFEAVSGRTRSELIGKNIRTLKIRDDDPEYFENMWETITSGHVWKDRVVQNQKNGQSRVVNVTVSPVRNSSGDIIAFVGIGHDVTEQVQLEARLLQAQKMEAIGTLAGGIAHDFNNLLQVILGYSELMLAERKPTESDYGDLERMRKAARSGAELVQRLLTFSRKVEPKPIPMDLNRQIRLVEKLLSRTLPKMIEIQADLEEGLPEIAADPTQVEQVLMNLAVNARDAMPEGGRLIIRTTQTVLHEADCRGLTGARPGEYVVLSVSDTGQGMDPETLEHIFEPFFTTKELGRGTGLGLATVYGICQQHGGFITCRSHVGQGTTFSSFFPALEREAPTDLADTGVMPAFGTETILLVDDEDLVRDLGERVLSRAGYTVFTADNGRQALEIYKQEKDSIALVVLDLIMPEMGGRPCLVEILKLNPEARVLIASGYAGDLPMTESLQIGAKGFVGKPFKMNELLQQVRRVLDAKP
ncbi:MAG: PAS domain S-box protein [Thermodesulfobacteriota bacterium]